MHPNTHHLVFAWAILPLFDLSPGDTLVSALRVRDDHGDALWYVLDAFRNQNGIFYDCAVSAEARSTWQPGQSIAPQEP